MGVSMSSGMGENLDSEQEFVQELNLVTLERQIQMHNQLRKRSLALQIAKTRELLYWFGSFYLIATVAMIAGFRQTRKPGTLVPLLPLTFLLGYHMDLAYGNKQLRITAEADNILKLESNLLLLPNGVPTPLAIDKAREMQRQHLKLHPAQPPLY